MREVQFGQERIPYKGFPRLAYRRQENHHTYEMQRYKCKCDGCDYNQQENIPFATGSCSYTHRFAKHVVDLLRSMTLKDAAARLDISWDMVKEIHSRYLESHYSPPSLDGVECIGIDEFAVKKCHIYKTIVVDLLSGRILHVGEGKGIEALADFWKKVRRKNIYQSNM